MKENLIRFGCDNCKKEIVVTETVGFPYIQGWCYIYNFNCQIEGIDDKGRRGRIDSPFARRIDAKDKHFCSINCMIKYLQGRLK